MSEKIFENYDDTHIEFNEIKESNKKVLMFFSVLAKLVSVSKDNPISKLDSEEDRLITRLLVDYSSGKKMSLLKQKLIMVDVVNYFNLFLENETERI